MLFPELATVIHDLPGSGPCAEGMMDCIKEVLIRKSVFVSLAALDFFLPVEFNSNFKIPIIEIPDDCAVEKIRIRDLKLGWRDFKDYSKCQILGERWLQRGKSAILKVPSAVIPSCSSDIGTLLSN